MRRTLAVLALLAAPAAAQNLAVNGTFTGGLFPWAVSLFPGTLQLSTLDANGSPSSGSALYTNDLSSGGQSSQFSQCVAVQGGVTYLLSAKVFVPSGQVLPGPNRNTIHIFFYGSTDCSGSSLNGTFQDAATAFDTWHPVTLTTTANPAARSARFGGAVQKLEAGSNRKAHFDDFVLAASAARTLTVVSSASIHGVNNAFFHTDLWVSNRSFSSAQTVTATLRCQTGFICPDGPRTFSLQPRETKLLEDVVGALFQLPEKAGTIELVYDAGVGEISATSRTYTPSLPNPTFGTIVPAYASSEARTRALFLGLGNNGGNRTAGFRSNAGVYSTSGGTITFKLVGANGQQLGTPVVRNMAANQPFQINDIFNEAGAGATVTTNAALVVSANTAMFPFVTVIDNQSGDSVWVLPTADEAP